ncbi:MAG TPA: hypothetical protein VK158_06500 [Acidobacteriota bacterium]|nr:hypothetical protein [Acidobacteriota bacterium]
MSSIYNFKLLPYVAHRGKIPSLETVSGDVICVSEAHVVYQDYHRLYFESLRRKKKGRAAWVEKITIDDIITWSGYEYWHILDKVTVGETIEPIHQSVVQQFEQRYAHVHPKEVHRWMLHHCHRSIVPKSMPGFLAEYIRRFENEDHVKNGYDKLLHFLWGAVLPDSIGARNALAVSYATELIDVMGFHPQDAMADHDAFVAGMKYAKRAVAAVSRKV